MPSPAGAVPVSTPTMRCNMSESTRSQAPARRTAGLSVFTMTMLTVAAVLSLRNLPSQAEYGYSIIFYISSVLNSNFI